MEKEISILKRVLTKESPILFLGAGFSIGGKLASGHGFPKGEELKFSIIKDFLKIDNDDIEYAELSSYNLSKVCQYAKQVKSEFHLSDYLCDLMRNSTPSDFHYLITKYNWKKIYTTNIDDIIETVYRQNKVDLLIQNQYRKSTLSKTCTEYLKLHGCVNNTEGGVVFGTDEYLESMVKNKDYRFNSLVFDISSENFIFVGSEFEEINIEYYFKLYESTGYKSSKGNLIFVNPKPSLFLQTRIKTSGAHLITWNTEQFLNYVEAISAAPEKIDTKNVTLKSAGFQLIKKEDFIHDDKNYDSNLYLGNDPLWKDILYDWDFVDDQLISDFNSFLTAALERNKVGIYSLYGKAFSGKSVFLKRLAVELLNKNFDVYFFKGRHFDYYSLYRVIKSSENNYFALIIDDASYNYKAIKQFSRLNFGGKQLIIVTSSRPFYHFRKRYHFIEELFKEYVIDSTITTSYAEVIINKLEEKGYLGELKKEPELEDRIKKAKSQSDIFSLLSYITEGNGFKDRMLREIVPIIKNDPLTSDLLLKTAIFEELDLPYFPKELITYIYADKSSHLLSIADDFLKFNEKGDVQFRAKFYAKNLLSKNGKSKIVDAISEILTFIAPQIHESSNLSKNSYWGEILEALTKQRLLKSIFRLSSQDIKDLLIAVRGYYNDNSHYWLQLGIAEQNLDEYEKALNHFKQAEALKPNSYIIQHAIGRNYMKQANHVKSKELAINYHDLGRSILIPLIESQEEYSVRAFSTHSYLNEELIYIEKYDIKISNVQLKKLFGYLQKIIAKDPEDVMAKHMSNHFIKFLQRTKRTNIINLNFSDLSTYKTFFKDYNLDMDELLDELS